MASYMWLSFVDRDNPVERDGRMVAPNLGCCIVEAGDIVEAVERAWALGCNPGGEVAGLVLDVTPKPEFVGRLFSPDEVDALDDSWFDRLPGLVCPYCGNKDREKFQVIRTVEDVLRADIDRVETGEDGRTVVYTDGDGTWVGGDTIRTDIYCDACASTCEFDVEVELG